MERINRYRILIQCPEYDIKLLIFHTLGERMDILQFNTGRQYSDHGQRIFAKIVGYHNDLDMHIVAMIDRDRHLAEYVLVFNFTREDIMAEYDKSRYYRPNSGNLPLFVNSRDYESEFLYDEILG
tara:strand:- start:489 stop:863 length:375 start_codon:yes stop_codon:yes gene_type:complete